MAVNFIDVTRPRREDLDNMKLDDLRQLVLELQSAKHKRQSNRNANRDDDDDNSDQSTPRL